MSLHAKRVDLKDITIPSSQTVEINGVAISYRKSGNGPVLFCMPPWPSSSIAFVPLMQALGDHVQTIAPDLPGWGGYSGGMPLAPDPDNYARLIEKFIASFGSDEYNLLGYSFGGVIAQTLISQTTHLPQKLILVSSFHTGNAAPNAYPRAVALAKFLLKIRFPLSICRPLAKRIILNMNPKEDQYYKGYQSTKIYGQGITENLRGDLHTVLCSLLCFDSDILNYQKDRFRSQVIYAEHDLSSVRSESKEIADYLGVSPICVENVDHNHLVYDVNKSSDAILDFLLS
ncbi:alpha/beta hydrolase [Candidatus Dojkabacteria bacterium]|uniref:Alpha/beta hydrolase n=1 Tax=Candidatus Dojkabacteria bacterium TaxID=2099670 RepID=A0A955I9X1_9BACT|nr:alpha/beta hydrolase [Candidatus Dojkabacteria bacterium]